MTRAARMFLLGTLLAAGGAGAGDFSVAPVRMELGASARTGVFTVRNEGRERLSFQVQGMDWTQDAEGRDQYRDASDLVYFPRILSLEGGQEAVIRVGVRQPVVQVEKPYRLFVEELPPAGGTAIPPASNVRVLVRFGPPIFVRPVKPEDRLDIERLQLDNGNARLTLRNAGNQHQRIDSVVLKGLGRGGETVFETTLADRYLLANVVKQYVAAVPRDKCLASAQLVAEVKAENAAARRQVDLDVSACR